jgi:hypothetical protein
LRRQATAILWLFCLAAAAHAQPRVKGAANYPPNTPIVLKATDVTGPKAQFLWDVSGGAKFVEAGDTLYVWAPPGDYTVRLTAIDFDAKKVERATFAFTVDGAPPPGPTPPGPEPKPPTPQPVAGLKVLILEESADRTKLPPAQVSLIAGKPFRDFLDSRCADDPETGTRKAWRIADKDQDLRAVAKFYQDAQARAKGQPMPRIVIGSDAGVVYEGPLPANLQEAQALLNKYRPAAQRRKAG